MNNKQIIQRQLKNVHRIIQSLYKAFQTLPKRHRAFIIGISALALILVLLPTGQELTVKNTNTQGFEVGKRYQVAMPGETTDTPSTIPIEIDIPSPSDSQNADDTEITTTVNSAQQSNISWQSVTVRNGDSLARIFKRLGFSAQETYAISSAEGKDSKLLLKMNVGDTLRIATNDEKRITALEYPLSKVDTLYINLVGDTYQSYKESKNVEIREKFAHGTISTNFWNAGSESGLTDRQIIELANIFGWDIDFALDIRAGDSFHIIFEEKFVDGDYIGSGNILAAEFINQDDSFQAIRFTDSEYYTPDGKSMRKAFLRAPVNFKYISSSFKRKRFHPVQKRWKAHRGVDYAAKTGTPVVAAGNGKVTHSTYNKYNGNYVFIQHGNGIVTKYLHFSKRAVKKGQRVKQGQLIGNVGSTGLAAGPHLHYEFLLNGVHRNPRTVKLPDAKPINKKYKAEFTALAAERLQAINNAKHTILSMSTDGKNVPHNSD
ncbi:OapA family protein [Colwellia sp. E150_009]|mgnify:CR=1 FL=1